MRPARSRWLVRFQQPSAIFEETPAPQAGRHNTEKPIRTSMANSFPQHRICTSQAETVAPFDCPFFLSARESVRSRHADFNY